MCLQGTERSLRINTEVKIIMEKYDETQQLSYRWGIRAGCWLSSFPLRLQSNQGSQSNSKSG